MSPSEVLRTEHTCTLVEERHFDGRRAVVIWKSVWSVVVFVSCVGLGAHGLLMFTDHVIWDGWLVDSFFSAERGEELMVRMASEGGRPLDAVFFSTFSLVSDRILAAKIAGVAAWIISFAAAAVVFRTLGCFSAVTSAAIGAIAATVPIFEVLGDLSMWMYTACACLFWLGLAIASIAVNVSGAAHLAARLLALALLFLSMNLNSLLVFFYAVVGVLVVSRQRLIGGGGTVGVLVRQAFRYSDFILVPAVFWVWKCLFTPTHGFYRDYNELKVGALGASYRYIISLVAVLIDLPLEVFSSSTNLLVGAILGVATAFALRRHQTVLRPRFAVEVGRLLEVNPREPLLLVVGGMTLLMACCVPYVVVGQWLEAWGWKSRNCILCPVPLAMTMVGVVMMMGRRLQPSGAIAWIVMLWFLGGAMASHCHSRYLKWQGFGATQLAVRAEIRKVIGERAPCVIQLRDYCVVPKTIDYYPPSIWTFIGAHGQRRIETFIVETAALFPDRAAIDDSGKLVPVRQSVEISSAVLKQLIDETTVPYFMSSVPLQGPQSLLAVTPAAGFRGGVGIGARYLFHRFFSEGGARGYLDTLVSAESSTLPPVAAR